MKPSSWASPGAVQPQKRAAFLKAGCCRARGERDEGEKKSEMIFQKNLIFSNKKRYPLRGLLDTLGMILQKNIIIFFQKVMSASGST